jgi:hypothetical protein
MFWRCRSNAVDDREELGRRLVRKNATTTPYLNTSTNAIVIGFVTNADGVLKSLGKNVFEDADEGSR